MGPGRSGGDLHCLGLVNLVFQTERGREEEGEGEQEGEEKENAFCTPQVHRRCAAGLHKHGLLQTVGETNLTTKKQCTFIF